MIPNILRNLFTPKPTTQTIMAKQSEPLELQKLATPEIRTAAEKIRAVSQEVQAYCDKAQEIFLYRTNLDQKATRVFNEIRLNPSVEKLKELLALRAEQSAFDLGGNVRLFTREEYFAQIIPRNHLTMKADIADFLDGILTVVRAELTASKAADAKIAAELGVEQVSSVRTDSAKNLEKFALGGNFSAACHCADLILDGQSAAMNGNIPIQIG